MSTNREAGSAESSGERCRCGERTAANDCCSIEEVHSASRSASAWCRYCQSSGERNALPELRRIQRRSRVGSCASFVDYLAYGGTRAGQEVTITLVGSSDRVSSNRQRAS